MDNLIQELRARRIMRDGGNGNVYDIADDVCEAAADEIERLRAALEGAHKAMEDAVGYGVTEEELNAVKNAVNQQTTRDKT